MVELRKDHRLRTFKEVQVALVINPQPYTSVTVAFLAVTYSKSSFIDNPLAFFYFLFLLRIMLLLMLIACNSTMVSPEPKVTTELYKEVISCQSNAFTDFCHWYFMNHATYHLCARPLTRSAPDCFWFEQFSWLAVTCTSVLLLFCVQRLCKKTVEHAIWTGRMLWIIDGGSFLHVDCW